MKNLIKLSLILLCMIPFSANAQNDQKIIVSLDSIKMVSDRPDLCEIDGLLTNNSFGTITMFRMQFNVVDDRGDIFDSYGADALTLGYFGGASLSVGASAKLQGSIIFDVKCEHIKEIRDIELEGRFCNMKMLPEDRECFDHLEVISELDGIPVNK